MRNANTSARRLQQRQLAGRRPVRRRREAWHEAHDAAVEDGEARDRETCRSLMAVVNLRRLAAVDWIR